MSRRQERRNRPASEAEQAQLREFSARVGQALTADTIEGRRAAVYRMRRLADRIRDPRNLAALSAAELVDALREQPPTGPVGIHHRYDVTPGIDADG